MIAAALNIARKEGIEGVTARGLGAELWISSQPIFSAFGNMEEVQKQTIRAARDLYNQYVEAGMAEDNPFRGVGMQYIRFAREEPRLFALLFMTGGEASLSLDEVLGAVDENSDSIQAAVQRPYGLSEEAAKRLYREIWIFTHGIACLCATGVTLFTEEECGRLLSDAFIALLTRLKKEEDPS